MRSTMAALMIAPAALALTACGEGGEEPPPGPADTSFEETAPNPVPDGGAGAEPVPDNTSVVGGPDERADAVLDYGTETPPPEPAPTPAD